ncbi:MAG: hypothetical protein ABI539_01210 [Acidobacteriota bacterium]
MKLSNRKTFLLCSLLVSLLVAASGFRCTKGPLKDTSSDGIFRGTVTEKYKLTTPKGAVIASAERIDPTLAALADAGLDDLFRIAAAPPNNYDVSDIPHSRFRIWLFPRSSKCIESAFLVDGTGSPYEGSEYDKDPSPTRCLLCAAGMTMMQGIDAANPGMIVTDDPAMMRRIVRYEGEHSILFYRDSERYTATMYHIGPNSGHPILGEGLPAIPSGDTAILTPVRLTAPAGLELTPEVFIPKGSDVCLLLTR